MTIKEEGPTEGLKVLDGGAVAAMVGFFVGRRVRRFVGLLVGATGLSLGEGLGSFVGNILGTGAGVATGERVTGMGEGAGVTITPCKQVGEERDT